MSIRREVLGKYLKPGDVFVETGTRWGDACIRALELGASYVETCETDLLMAALAEAHIADHSHGKSVHVDRRPSCEFLHNLGVMLHARSALSFAVVFLDAHTDLHSPVVGELEAIAKWPTRPKTILIDDMRCMRGWLGGDPELLCDKLRDMGYAVGYEDGVEKSDILVGVRQ